MMSTVGERRRSADSYRRGVDSLPGQLAIQAAAHPDRPFVVAPTPDGGVVTTTYGEFEAQARSFAGVLGELGIGKGDRVHVQLTNVREFLVCLFGAAHIGAVVVATNQAATVDDVTYVTSHAGCMLSVVAAAHVPVVAAAQEMVPELRHVLSVGPAAGATELSTAMAAVAPCKDGPAAAGDDLAAVLYTSGTSGWPKGAMLTHANLVFAGEAVAAHLRMRPDDRWLVILPLSHLNALGYSTMSALVTGASVALIDRFVPAEWSQMAATLDVTMASTFAIHARRILATPEQPHDAGHPMRLTVFAQHLDPAERARFEARFATSLLQVYGLTETIAPTLSDPVFGERRPDTVGRPTLWAHTRVVDHDGHDIGPGGDGELLVGGQPGRTLMAGYYGRPDETEAVLRDGWLHTGDWVRADGDGYFTYLGRRDEIIKPGVHNVSAVEIERVQLEHVSVADAAVIGVRDAQEEERIVAFVVLRPGDDATVDELTAWAKDRLTWYKVPHHILTIDQLPRNPVGKVVKRDLEQHAQATRAVAVDEWSDPELRRS